jgi:hypothetical protein
VGRRGLVASTASTAFVGALVACGLDMRGLGTTEGAYEAGADVGVSEGGADAALAPDAWNAPDGQTGSESGADDAGTSDVAGGEATAGDAPASMEAGCSGLTCNGACIAATDCRGCLGAPLLCASTKTCAADCSACAANPIECFACDAQRQNPVGTCESADPRTYCLNTDYGAAYGGGAGTHCGCQVAADCPGEDQVCISVGGTAVFACFSCGETYTQAFDCKNGGKCNAQQATCN